MKKKVYSAVILLSLAAPALVVAADKADDAAEVHGVVELGVRGVNTNGDKAKAQEFRDQDDSVLGNIQLDALKGAYYFEFDGKNIGLDDQSYEGKGGDYNKFKYKFDYDEFTHNYGFGDITPYLGIGTSQITPVASPATKSTWTPLDYSVEHKKYGGEVEISMDSPYFVNIGVERREQSGLLPFGQYRPTPAEVAEPISNTTNDVHLKAGYRGESLMTSITGSLSSFANDFKYMNTSSTTNNLDNLATFAPDNRSGKLGVDLTYRDLPLHSVFAAAASYSRLTDDYSAVDLGLPAVYVPATGKWTLGGATGYNTNVFNGQVDNTAFSTAISSNPIDKLDTKIYYRYMGRDNKSDLVNYSTTNNAKELLSYNMSTAGLDIGYRLPQKTKLTGGYEYQSMDRSTPNGTNLYPTDTTRKGSEYIQIKNSILDWLTAKLGYTHTKQDSGSFGAITTTTPFAYMDQSSNAWKLGFDLYPVDRLDLGLAYTYKKIKYDDPVRSRIADTQQSTYLDATWHVYGKATLTGTVGFETVSTDTSGYYNPSTYTQTTDDDFWSYGLVANVPGLLDDKLTLNFSWQYQKSDGGIDFNNGPTTTYQNITDSNDYTKKTLEAKATYALAPKLGMTVGYLYEKLKSSDYAYDNFTNILTNTAGSTTYYDFSGLYANQSYEANIGYVMLKYAF